MNAVYWDPYRPDFWKDPYPVFRSLREEAPLYYNMGPQTMTARIVRDGASFTGTLSHQMGDQDIAGKISGSTLTWTLSLTKPVSIKLGFEATIDGDTMTGSARLGMFGKATLTGRRVG